MADTRELRIVVAGDNAKLRRTLRDTETQTQRFAKRLEGVSAGRRGGGLGSTAALLKGGGVALGAGLAANQFAKLSTAASDLNEQLSASGVIFGTSAQEIEAWSKTLATSFGIAQTEGVAAAATFGSLFSAAGQTKANAASLSRTVVELAGDLSSFKNTSVDEAVTALRSGLSGEIEPLRRYQVFLTEAAVAQEALEQTGKRSAKQLTQGEKILARYSLILKQTSLAQGDAARTSGSLANQQRELRAKLSNTRAELGGRLLPIMVKATEGANKMLAGFETAHESVLMFDSPDFRDKFIGAFGLEKFVEALERIAPELNAAREQFIKEVFQPIDFTVKPSSTKAAAAFGQPGFKPGKAAAVRLGPSVEQRNTIFDNSVSRALFRGDDLEPAKQLESLRKVSATLTARIAATKDVTRKLNLEDHLLSVNRQSKGLREQIAQDFADRIAKEKLRKQEAAATRLSQITARQFRQLGLGADGSAVTPGVANLKKRLGSFEDNVKGTFLDTSKTQTQLARFRKVLSEALVPKDVRAKFSAMLDDLNQQLRDHASNGPLTKTTGLNTKKILEGLGLSPGDERELRSRLSHFNSAGVALAGASGPTGSFLGGRPIVVESHTTVQLDGHTVGKTVTRSQQKTRSRNPAQRRGPNRGAF